MYLRLSIRENGVRGLGLYFPSVSMQLPKSFFFLLLLSLVATTIVRGMPTRRIEEWETKDGVSRVYSELEVVDLVMQVSLIHGCLAVLQSKLGQSEILFAAF